MLVCLGGGTIFGGFSAIGFALLTIQYGVPPWVPEWLFMLTGLGFFAAGFAIFVWLLGLLQKYLVRMRVRAQNSSLKNEPMPPL